ncbi:MAG: type III-A CRISPR-associated protein Cas10/Csm1 [bacterium]
MNDLYLNDLYLIALAGLLHDIGKFCQRANYYNTWDKKNLENTYKYQHAFFSYQYLNELSNILKESLNLSKEELNNLIEISARHHNPIQNNIKNQILNLADNLSSTERERNQKSHINLLHPIFERISFLPEKEIKNPSFHKISKLYLSEDIIFPISDNNIYKNTNEITKQYKTLFSEFNNEVKNIKNFKGVKAFNYIYYLLEKYLWSVPSSTYDTQNLSLHYSDISLFDHLRVVAMLSVALLDYYNQNNNEVSDISFFNNNPNKDIFLIIEVNIGGIQNFIYNIAKTTSIQDFSISKSLRGRSLLITLLTELIARSLLKELNYPITNILYIGGGKFQIIAANTSNNINILKNIEQRLAQYLFNEFHMDIKMLIAYQEFSINNLKGITQNFSQIIEKLQIKIDKQKKQLFKNQIFQDFDDDQKDICKSCKSLPVSDQKEICKLCDLSNFIGQEVIFLKYISFDLNKKLKLNENKCNHISIIDFDDWGNIYLISSKIIEDQNLNEIEILDNIEEVLKINDTDFGIDKISNGFKFIANTVPIINKDVKNYILNNLELTKEEKEEIKEGVMPFRILSNFSIGDKKLAAIRADIDNLGLILSDGLKSKEKINNESINNESIDTDRYTFSRIATLSRMLELFFSGYLNILIKQESQRYLQSYISTDLVYTVYSGGDDLFLIGPYNFILDFSLKLREKLYLYTSKNLDFGLSSGIFIFNYNLPINKVARYSESQEKKSKDSKFYIIQNNKEYIIHKDSITIFNKTYKWFNNLNQLNSFNIILNNKGINKTETNLNYIAFEDILVISKELADYANKKLISKSVLYRILEYYRIYVKNNKINPLIYPKIYYQIAKNINNQEVKEKLEKYLIKTGYNKLSKEQIIINLDTILYLCLMLVRN